LETKFALAGIASAIASWALAGWTWVVVGLGPCSNDKGPAVLTPLERGVCDFLGAVGLFYVLVAGLMVFAATAWASKRRSWTPFWGGWLAALAWVVTPVLLT
jgi:hypothetical protein